MENLKKYCETCGAELKEHAMFCESCGTKVKVQEAPKKHFCSSCGTELSETAVFCETCGAKVNGEISAVQETQPEADVRTNKLNAFTCEFKTFAGSPLFLILAILVSLSGVLGLLQFNIVSFVTYILLIIGCWILWAKSRSEEGNPFGGVKLIKSAVTFNFVMGIIAVSLIALIFVILIIVVGAGADFIGNLGDVDTSMITIILVLVGAIVIGASFTLVILYYKSILGFLNSLMYSLNYNKDYASNKAMYPAIMIFVFSGFSLISLISSMATAAAMNELIYQFASELPEELMDIVLSATQTSSMSNVIGLLNLAVGIFGGVLMIIYKGKFSKQN